MPCIHAVLDMHKFSCTFYGYKGQYHMQLLAAASISELYYSGLNIQLNFIYSIKGFVWFGQGYYFNFLYVSMVGCD